MHRFLSSVGRRILWFVGLVAASYWISAQDIGRRLLDWFINSPLGRGVFRNLALFLAAHPGMIVPLFAGAGFVGILVYCVYDSHLSGKPLIKVTGIPMKGSTYIRPEDQRNQIGLLVGDVYVPIENVSHGTDEKATAKDLSARIELRGLKLRRWGDFKAVVSTDDGQVGTRISLRPGDKARFLVVIGDPNRQGSLLEASSSTLNPSSANMMGGLWLTDPLYIAKVTFRGIGVHQTMWFSVWNFEIENDWPNSIYGPLGPIERLKLRLHLLGLRKKWMAYRKKD